MEESDVYRPPKYSLKQKFGVFIALLFFLGAGGVFVYFRYYANEPGQLGSTIQEQAIDAYPEMSYDIIYNAHNAKTKVDSLFRFNMHDLEVWPEASKGFIEELSFLQTKKNAGDANTEAVSRDGTMFVEVLPGERGDVLWLNNIWEPNKEKLYELPAGVHPILIGFSADSSKIYYDMFDITGLPAGLLISLDIASKTVVETIAAPDAYERVTTPVLSPDGTYFVSVAWKKQGDFAQATFQSVLLFHDFSANTTVTIQRGQNFIFNNIVWSPKSDYFAFSQYQPREGKEYDLGMWQYSVQSKQFSQINPIGRPAYWTPDGRYIIFTTTSEGGVTVGMYDKKEKKIREIMSGITEYISFWGTRMSAE